MFRHSNVIVCRPRVETLFSEMTYVSNGVLNSAYSVTRSLCIAHTLCPSQSDAEFLIAFILTRLIAIECHNRICGVFSAIQTCKHQYRKT